MRYLVSTTVGRIRGLAGGESGRVLVRQRVLSSRRSWHHAWKPAGAR